MCVIFCVMPVLFNWKHIVVCVCVCVCVESVWGGGLAPSKLHPLPLESTAVITLRGKVAQQRLDVGNQPVKWLIQPRAMPSWVRISDAERIDRLHLRGALHYSRPHIDPHLERRPWKRPEESLTTMWDPDHVFQRFFWSLMKFFMCFFFFFSPLCLVWVDEAAKRFQDHSEDTGGQFAVPSVLGFGRLPGRHGAGGKPGNDQKYRGRDRRQGSVSFNLYLCFYFMEFILINPPPKIWWNISGVIISWLICVFSWEKCSFQIFFIID